VLIVNPARTAETSLEVELTFKLGGLFAGVTGAPGAFAELDIKLFGVTEGCTGCVPGGSCPGGKGFFIIMLDRVGATGKPTEVSGANFGAPDGNGNNGC